jgi:hypothetical protein
LANEYVTSVVALTDDQYIKEIQPDINLKVDLEIEGEIDTIDLPIGVNFFFPDL